MCSCAPGSPRSCPDHGSFSSTGCPIAGPGWFLLLSGQERLAGALCRLFRKPLENSPQSEACIPRPLRTSPQSAGRCRDHDRKGLRGRRHRRGTQPQNGRSTGLVASAQLRKWSQGAFPFCLRTTHHSLLAPIIGTAAQCRPLAVFLSLPLLAEPAGPVASGRAGCCLRPPFIV